jgi:beta-glucanase (GH16 family)
MKPLHCLPGLIVAGLFAAQAAPADLAGWKLVWSDEFNGKSLDPAKWSFEVNAEGGGNRELQYYVTNNVTVTNGFLTITARHEAYTGPEGTREYTSSRIRTLGKGDWRYGRFEMRARLPEGRGIWPAFWMLPTESRYGGWPHSGEIDLMELVGHLPEQVHGTLHYSGPDGHHRYRDQFCAATRQVCRWLPCVPHRLGAGRDPLVRGRSGLPDPDELAVEGRGDAEAVRPAVSSVPKPGRRR